MDLKDGAKSGKEIVTFKPPLDESTRKWQLSATDIIEELRQRLSGYNYSENHQKWERGGDKENQNTAWMNEKGIGRVSNIINFYINKNMQLSYFDEERIENMTLSFAGELSEFMRFHYKEYGIEKEHVGIIFHMICDTVYASLQRARLGKESQFIENTEQRMITTMEGGQNSNQSMLSKLPVLGRFAK